MGSPMPQLPNSVNNEGQEENPKTGVVKSSRKGEIDLQGCDKKGALVQVRLFILSLLLASGCLRLYSGFGLGCTGFHRRFGLL